MYADVLANRDIRSEALRARLRALELAKRVAVRERAADAVAQSLATSHRWPVLAAFVAEEPAMREDDRAAWQARAGFGLGEPAWASALPGVLGDVLGQYASARSSPRGESWWLRPEYPELGHLVRGRDGRVGRLVGPIQENSVSWGTFLGAERLRGVEGTSDLVLARWSADPYGLYEARLYRVVGSGDAELALASPRFTVGDVYRAVRVDGDVLVATGHRRRGIVVLSAAQGGFQEVPSTWPSFEAVSDVVNLQSVEDDGSVLVVQGPWTRPGVTWVNRRTRERDRVDVPRLRMALADAAAPSKQAWAIVNGPPAACVAPSLAEQGLLLVPRRGGAPELRARLPCPTPRLGPSELTLGRLADISTGRHRAFVAEVQVQGAHGSLLWFIVEDARGGVHDAFLGLHTLESAGDVDGDGLAELWVGDHRTGEPQFLGTGARRLLPHSLEVPTLQAALDLPIPDGAGASWRVARRLASWGLRQEAFDELREQGLGPEEAATRAVALLEGHPHPAPWVPVQPDQLVWSDADARLTGSPLALELLGRGHDVAWAPLIRTGEGPVGVRVTLAPYTWQQPGGTDLTRFDLGARLDVTLWAGGSEAAITGVHVPTAGALPASLRLEPNCSVRGRAKGAGPPVLRLLDAQPSWFRELTLEASLDLGQRQLVCSQFRWQELPAPTVHGVSGDLKLPRVPSGTLVVLKLSSDASGYPASVLRVALTSLAVQGLEPVRRRPTDAPAPARWPVNEADVRDLETSQDAVEPEFWARPDPAHSLFPLALRSQALGETGATARALVRSTHGAQAALWVTWWATVRQRRHDIGREVRCSSLREELAVTDRSHLTRALAAASVEEALHCAFQHPSERVHPLRRAAAMLRRLPAHEPRAPYEGPGSDAWLRELHGQALARLVLDEQTIGSSEGVVANLVGELGRVAGSSEQAKAWLVAASTTREKNDTRVGKTPLLVPLSKGAAPPR